MNILVTPLSWGLGHATRCIPIIQNLLQANHNVFIASDGRAGSLLQIEFPDLPYFELPEWNVQYVKDNENLGWAMLKQTPGVLYSIYKENKKIQKIVEANKIEIIISDNRFGCYSNQCKRNILISHQVEVLMPKGLEYMDTLAKFSNYYCFNKFDELWIPDYNDQRNISGKLSFVNENKLHIPYYYIGQISRFKKENINIEYDLAVVLSGPEPQRTIFENIILKQLSNFVGKAIVILGKPELSNNKQQNNNIEILQFADAVQLNSIINKSEIIIARSGYSTVMDIVQLNKKAIFVPTPQQTEQEYIAEYLQSKKYYATCNQQEFNLKKMLLKSEKFNILPNFNSDEKILNERIKALTKYSS